MTFDQIISTTKNRVTEDGFELEKDFDFWRPFNYNKIKWSM